MKLSGKYEREMPYMLDTGDGQFYRGLMEVNIAREIVRTREMWAASDIEGFELLVNNRMLFPLDGFEFDEGELPENVRRVSRRKLADVAPENATKRELMAIAESYGWHGTYKKITKAKLREIIDAKMAEQAL